jgi:alpha-D-ribose 1-methylphosphonate 5-phosphate C-P lyase
MAKMVITHGVADVEKWLSFKAERAAAISAMGVSDVVDLVAEDGSNAVAISANVDDVAAVLAATSSPSPELGAAMTRHGVLPPLTVYVEK